MSIRTTRRRGGPIYRQCGSEVISYVPEIVVREVRLPGTSIVLFTLVEKAVHVIDKDGVRRRRDHIGVKLGRE